MEPDPQPIIHSAFPDARYFPDVRLITWHPVGLFDEHLADRVVEFMEYEESVIDGPFYRFANLNGLTEVRLKVGHAFQLIERRRTGYRGPPVKSAFFCESIVGFGIARMYEALMDGANIEVRAFRKLDEAVAWLGVPRVVLLPTP